MHPLASSLHQRLCIVNAHPFPLSVVVTLRCNPESLGIPHLSLQRFFFQTQPFPSGRFLRRLYRSGFLRSRFPCLRYYDCATTAHCHSRSFLAYTSGTVGLPLFRVAWQTAFASPLYSWSMSNARCICIPPCPSAAFYFQRR